MTTEEPQEEQEMTSSEEEDEEEEIEIGEELGEVVEEAHIDDDDVEEAHIDDDDVDDEDEDEIPQKREPYNDQAGLQSKLKEITLDLDWRETLSVTTDTTNLKPHNGQENINKETDGKDDFRREMLFYCQAQDAVKQALSKLNELKVPTQRPEDYFAEMVKSDVHMQKVRKKLLEKKDGMEASEKAKRQRELKKIGKKVQQNVLQKRQEDKKKMLKEVDRMKKGKSDKLYGDKDVFDVTTEKKSGIGSKRKHKDEKFGHGGRKRKLKKNSAESAAEMTSFKSHVHGKGRSGPPGRGKGRGPPGAGRGPPGGGREKNANRRHPNKNKKGKR